MTLVRIRVAAVVVALAACGGTAPEVHHYQLVVDTPTAPPSAPSSAQVLAVTALASHSAYDDERIVYRKSPYQLDYYNYHRWSATPGVLVAGYLEQALARTGAFKAVVGTPSPDAAWVLGGTITAIEEIDRDASHWQGRIALDLTLTDPATGAIVWTQRFDETEPLAIRSPEGLARALSVALGRIATRAAPLIAEHAQPTRALSQRAGDRDVVR
jgi:cholesterol transport system auxiliary component